MKLGKKWNPNVPEIDRKVTEEKKELTQEEGRMIIDPDFTTRGFLKEGFRVFTESERVPNEQVLYTTP